MAGDTRDRGRERMRASAGTRVAISVALGFLVASAAALLGPWQVAVLAGQAAAMATYVG